MYNVCFQVDGELFLAPGFPAPPNTDYLGYHNYIDECMPPESPYLYGLHPNAEIGFLTTKSENLFRTVFEMQPREAGTAGGATVTREDKVIMENCIIVVKQFKKLSKGSQIKTNIISLWKITVLEIFKISSPKNNIH